MGREGRDYWVKRKRPVNPRQVELEKRKNCCNLPISRKPLMWEEFVQFYIWMRVDSCEDIFEKFKENIT